MVTAPVQINCLLSNYEFIFIVNHLFYIHIKEMYYYYFLFVCFTFERIPEIWMLIFSIFYFISIFPYFFILFHSVCLIADPLSQLLNTLDYLCRNFTVCSMLMITTWVTKQGRGKEWFLCHCWSTSIDDVNGDLCICIAVCAWVIIPENVSNIVRFLNVKKISKLWGFAKVLRSVNV